MRMPGDLPALIERIREAVAGESLEDIQGALLWVLMDAIDAEPKADQLQRLADLRAACDMAVRLHA